MKRYKLLKDLPTFKAGQLAYISGQGSLIAGTPDNPEITYTGVQLMMYHKTTLDKFPEILTEWFKEISEPTDSIHWKPNFGDKYWVYFSDGEVTDYFWTNKLADTASYKLGRTYHTQEECERAYERQVAEVRLRRTSTFEPDFENNNSGYVVYYDFRDNKLDICSTACCSYGERVHYKTKEDAEKSIKENKRDWKIYFGIEEEI